MSYEFRLYATQDLEAAISLYEKRTGISPTIALVRPSFEHEKDNKIITVFPSRFGITGGILLTHKLNINDLIARETVVPGTTLGTGSKFEKFLNFMKPKKRRGKPPDLSKPRCPHCQQAIRNFDNLGFWWGWEHGIEPPYWQQLRLYVMERDDFYCVGCQDKFESKQLTVHHIEPKEEGGADSARNLELRCKDCHQDTKPIFNDEHDQRTTT